MPPTEDRTTTEIKQWIEQEIQKRSKIQYRPDQVERMRWMVAGRLDKWLGKAPRRYFLNHLFPKSDGSTKPLTAAQLSVLVDWMALEHDELNGWLETERSAVAMREMAAILTEVQLV